MDSRSDSQRARLRLRGELWAWTCGLILCIISYPAVAAARAAPWAGLVGGLGGVGCAATLAWLGHAGRGEPGGWSRAAVLCLSAFSAVSITALLADGCDLVTAAAIGGASGAEIGFVWHFLPSVVREAGPAGGVAKRGLRLVANRRGITAVRPSLALALLLGFITLGLGGLWSRAVSWAPNPAGWLVALVLCALGLMFVERMSFFERSAREGNLVMPAGSFGRWVGAGLLLLLCAGLLATAGPWRPLPAKPRSTWAGDRARSEIPAEMGVRTEQAPSAVEPAASSQSPAATGMAPRGALPLLLLLVLLILALILIWGFAQTRAAQWLLAMAAGALSRLVRAWQYLWAWARRRWARPGEPGATAAPGAGEVADPLFDIFEHPEAFARLTPREVLIRTYHLLLNFAEMLGHGRRPGETPFEYLRTLAGAAPAAREPVRALTWGYAGAMYADQGTPLPQPSVVQQAWREAAEALKGEMTPEDFDLRRRAYLAARRLEQGR